DQEVEMIGNPTMFNGKLMVDFFPWRDNRWHLTVGFYYGSSRVARAINAITEMPSLLAVDIYNSFYDKDFLYEPLYGDVYLDPDKAMALREKFDSYGRMGVHLGDYPDGSPYMLTPHTDGTVRANMHVNRFKPYIGFGYQGTIGSSRRWSVGFDCGAMMWGGTPKLITHDGIDLISDVNNVPGKVGSYVSTISQFKVWPVLNFRIAYTIF
ncbi:MAG: hypothetical protein K2M76_03265, partial [Muribaculaceae bacterium]|nr:hypothetical protein [Muribaculaceae bacterium]